MPHEDNASRGDAVLEERLASAWFLLHKTSRWAHAFEDGLDPVTAFRSLADELDLLAKPFEGCPAGRYITGREVVIGSYADQFRQLADYADQLPGEDRGGFVFVIFDLIRNAGTIAIASADRMRQALSGQSTGDTTLPVC